MNINAREVVPGAVWAVSLPIIPGVTGELIEREPCKCLDGRHGGLQWVWWVTVRPPGWRPNPTVFDGVNLATALRFENQCPRKVADMEFSRVDTPADR